jgi:7-cyano-7-deazaguanine synthase
MSQRSGTESLPRHLSAPGVIATDLRRRPMMPGELAMSREKAVVLMSGGLNSAVAASVAAVDYNLAGMHVRFGHRAGERERDLFEGQANHFDIGERLITDMPHFAAIGGNARVSRKHLVQDAMATGEDVSTCYVPGLIGALVQAAFTWARAIDATRIFIGVSEDLGPPAPKLYLAYPDYSREYLQLCNHQLAVASPDKAVSVEMPLVDLTRSEIIKLGRRLETPFDLTWSCLSSASQGCGTCLGCATRNRGFLDAATPDPILLQSAAQV